VKLEAKGGVYLASCNDIAETDQSSKVVNVPSAGISVCFSHLPSIPYFVFLLVRLFCESSSLSLVLTLVHAISLLPNALQTLVAMQILEFICCGS
jgi:hypothetical protein